MLFSIDDKKDMNAIKEIRIMIIGDFLIFRNGLKLLLEADETVKVVGEASDLSEAANLINKINPEILLLESTEIDNNSFETFVSSLPRYIPMIVLVNSRELEKHKKYLLLGIDGLVSKEQTAEVLFSAIKQVNKGNMWFDRKLMSETIKQLINEKKLIPEKFNSYNSTALTEREREVLLLICQGMKNKTIADTLFITETTVRHHLTSIFEKLKVTNRLELVVFAFKEKMVEIPPETIPSFDF